MGVSPEEKRELGFEGIELLGRGSGLLLGQSLALFEDLIVFYSQL